MVIKDIKLVERGGEVTLKARCKIRKIGWDTIYFTVDAKHRQAIFNDASPFAAALLLPAMRQGEDLIIKGSISQQLYDGMLTIMDTVSQWGVGLKVIKIKADAVVPDTHRPNRTASFFSAGVDSFYTYLKHKKDTVKSQRVGTLIFLGGFDVDYRNKSLWQAALKSMRSIAAQEHLDLVVIQTNARRLLEPLLPRGELSHGGCMAAAGLLIRNTYRRIYIPSTFTVADQMPWGSHADVDDHWSTEKLTFVHDGLEATRNNKVFWQIAKSPLALKYLRVCYENKRGTYNCATCDKCLRTMVNLYAAGALEKSATFPHKLNLKLIAEGTEFKGLPKTNFLGEQQNLEVLEEKNMDPPLQAALHESVKNTIATHNTPLAKLKTRHYLLQYKVMYVDFAYFDSKLHRLLARPFGKKFA